MPLSGYLFSTGPRTLQIVDFGNIQVTVQNLEITVSVEIQ